MAVLVEFACDRRKVKIRKGHCKPQLAHHWYACFYHASPTPRSCLDTNKRHRLMNIFTKQEVKDAFQSSRISVIVFGRDDHQTVCSDDSVPPVRKLFFDLLPIMIGRKMKITNVEELSLDLFAIVHF